MPTFVKVAAVSDVAPGSGKTVDANGKEIALFNVGGTFYAIDNTCTHRQGPLGEGELEGDVVTCPWHGWQFNVANGESLTDDTRVACFPVKVEAGDILIEV
jgi:nitrite reductase/ring-hydroxylating ferredoxin subunit